MCAGRDRCTIQVKNFLAERVQELEAPDGFAGELSSLQGNVSILQGDNATLEEHASRASRQVQELQDQVCDTCLPLACDLDLEIF